MEDRTHIHHHSFIIRAFSAIVEWGNKWLVSSHWFFKQDPLIFVKIEIEMLTLNTLFFIILFTAQYIPEFIHPFLYLVFIQRILEFVIVYSRNFILKRGRIYNQFHGDINRGVWLILMFTLSIMQMAIVFATWFRLISLDDPSAFSDPLGALDSLYFSVVTFLTIGYGDIAPLKELPKVLMMIEGALTYFVLVIVINGLNSTHFGDRHLIEPTPTDSEQPKQ